MPKGTSGSARRSSGREAVALLYDELFLHHRAPYAHPESPDRLRAIRHLLHSAGVEEELMWLPVRPADEEDIRAVHTDIHLQRVLTASLDGGGYLDADTFTNSASYDAAMMAAGAVQAGVDAVLSGECRRAFALVRPPGHHATPGRAMGFCLFNNVAVGARYAQRVYGLQRIFIVDWDVHHGNGTQDIFYTDPDVFFFSVHQYLSTTGELFYPGTGQWVEIGFGPGQGTTANVPLPAGMNDAVYRQIWHLILIPLLRRWQPELILISAGYDAHWRDPLANIHLSIAGFGHLARRLIQVADELGAPVVATLEGGYDLEALALGVLSTIRAMQGAPLPVDPLGTPASTPPTLDVLALLDRIRAAHGV
ncbi:MAG: histone deacetylase [Ardenticatenia bacterium]|nr:histone deacetylase [Ardenticatenia bacterium]